ncbi:DNA replication/repair protein RecF [bacterium]|nr:DNA replication/repair protein RecF [bacterium]
MKLKSIKLKNYRNCENIEIDFCDFKNLIRGKNAQGKTNILESIYFLSNLKSVRTSNNLELIQFEKEKTEINAIIEKNNTNIEIDFSYNDEKKKTFALNKVKSTQKDFKQVLKTVLFSSEDLMLLRGAPEDRRKWLDRAISQIYPLYDDRLSKYEKIRTQKNNLLKDEKIDKSLLDVYNEQLAIAGSNVIFLRKKYLSEIEKISQKKHSKISETENLKMYYSSTFELGETIEEILENYKNALKENYTEEIRRTQSLIGPHRDDIVFFINDKEATKFASQGQQRTVVLALKMAEIDIIKEKTGTSPVLLLDDVLAELDDLRQNYLLNSIERDTQTIITSVDTLFFNEEFLKDVKIFKINNGKIE